MAEPNQEKQADDQPLQEDFQELQQEYEDIKQTLQRTHADFQNYKKRVDRDREKHKQKAIKTLAQDLLPYLDNQELALNNAEDLESFKQSIELNHQQLLDILEEHGITQITNNTEFNPRLHEALLIEEGEEDNQILDVLQTGYKLGDNVLRHAKVKISKANNGENNE